MRNILRASILVCGFLTSGIVPYAAAQTIGLYSDTDCQSRTLTIAFPGEPVDLYVMYSNPGVPLYFDEAEFKIYGLPSEWKYEVIRGAQVVELLGDPVTGPVGHVRLSACMAPGCIELVRVRVTPTQVVGPRQILLSGEDNDDVRNCSLVAGCGAAYDVKSPSELQSAGALRIALPRHHFGDWLSNGLATFR